MTTSRISLQARATGPDLQLHFWLDGVKVGHMWATENHQLFTHDFPDNDADHVFEIELSGKSPAHTEIDQKGNILQDRVVEISDMSLDDIPLGHLVVEHSRYHHDHNGTSLPMQSDFFGTMGCNGRVQMKFSTPTYLWLLENI